MIWAVNLVQVQYSQQIQVGKRRRRGNGFLPSTELLSCMRIEEGEKHNTKATWRLHSTLFFKISVNQHQNGLCVIHFSPFLLCGYHYRASSSKLLAVILKIENWIYSDNNGDSVMWRKNKESEFWSNSLFLLIICKLSYLWPCQHLSSWPPTKQIISLMCVQLA